MSTITSSVSITETNKRFKRAIMSASSSIDAAQTTYSRVELIAGQSKTLSFTKQCVAYFPKPTLIQLTIGGTVTTPTVSGVIVLPFAGSIKVEHPGVGVTDPTEVEFLTL